MKAIWAVSVIVSILIIGTLVLSQDVFATNTAHVVVTPDRQSGPINQLQTFTVEFRSDGIIQRSTLTISCDPSIQINFNPNIARFVPQQITVNSNTPGIVICEARVDGNGRSTGDARLRLFSVFRDFVAVFNELPLTCGAGTTLDIVNNECVQALVVTQQIADLQADLATAQANLAAAQATIAARDATISGLEADITALNAEIAAKMVIIADLEDDLAAALSDLATALDDLNTAQAALADAQAALAAAEDERDQALADLAAAQASIAELEAILLSGEITICHNGKNTLTIGLDAFGTHAGHGDTIGACP